MTIDELLLRMRTPGCSDTDCGACENNRTRARLAIDDISRAAKLECLRELRDRCNQAGSTHYWPEVIDTMIASLETEAAEPAKEET